MQPVHHNVTYTKSIKRGRELRRNALAVDIDDKRGLARTIEALADADSEERWILHPLVRDLPLHRNRLCDNRCRKRRNGGD